MGNNNTSSYFLLQKPQFSSGTSWLLQSIVIEYTFSYTHIEPVRPLFCLPLSECMKYFADEVHFGWGEKEMLCNDLEAGDY